YALIWIYAIQLPARALHAACLSPRRRSCRDYHSRDAWTSSLVVQFADRVALAGMTASLCGVAGRPADHPLSRFTILYGVCVRREFNNWAAGRSSPIVDWLRALARRAFQECGGRGVGAVGMCFTGGFALAMMTEPSVVAPVLSQPSLPLAGKNFAESI